VVQGTHDEPRHEFTTERRDGAGEPAYLAVAAINVWRSNPGHEGARSSFRMSPSSIHTFFSGCWLAPSASPYSARCR